MRSESTLLEDLLHVAINQQHHIGFKRLEINSLGLFNASPNMPVLSSSNSAANKDMMSKIWTNGNTIIDCVEKIVRKGDIAHHEQFLFFLQCFQELSVVDASK